MTAQIVQNDGGGPVTGTVDNGSLTTVSLSNLDDTGVLGWSWELMYRPQGSTASIADPNASSSSFTADVNGTFLVRLTTYADAARTLVNDQDEQCYAIRLGAPYAWRIPAAGEAGQYDSAAGWAPAREAAIRDIHAFLTNPDLVFVKHKRDATTAPGPSNDNTEGYEVSSTWIDVTGDAEYVCVDASTGAAVWVGRGASSTLRSPVVLDDVHAYTVGDTAITTATGLPVQEDLLVWVQDVDTGTEMAITIASAAPNSLATFVVDDNGIFLSFTPDAGMTLDVGGMDLLGTFADGESQTCQVLWVSSTHAILRGGNDST